VQEGKFPESAALCDALFALIPLLVVHSKAEVAEVKAITGVVAEYKTACRIMLAARATDPADGTRQIELAAYMTHCALEPPHLMLAVNLAMAQAFKNKNFIHAAGFARRLLEMPDIQSAKNAQLLQRVSGRAMRMECVMPPAALCHTQRLLRLPIPPLFLLLFALPFAISAGQGGAAEKRGGGPQRPQGELRRPHALRHLRGQPHPHLPRLRAGALTLQRGRLHARLPRHSVRH
jgi:hypothetical protein